LQGHILSTTGDGPRDCRAGLGKAAELIGVIVPTLRHLASPTLIGPGVRFPLGGGKIIE